MSEGILEISGILSYLIKQAHISEAELARKVNIPRATINRLVSGRTPDPRASTLNAIAEYFNVSVDQLLGKQPLFLDNKESIITISHLSIPIITWEETKNWEGIINKLKPDNHFDWVMVDPAIERGKFAIRVDGESMWPQFQTNTILIMVPEKEAKNRDFVIAYIKKSDEVVFRQLIVEGKYKFLKAINTIFPTIQLEDTDKIIGIVIQTRKDFR
ncbi:MAG TPA: XRE family transcriptional regulator [Gammaproteobacteria bacterium]|nr:XRE family transcriptional regulator [Gammaproteobacteria bacterium]